MLTNLFLKGRLRHALTNHENNALENAIEACVNLAPKEVLIRKGELAERSTYLIEGYMLRYIDGIDGDRQIVCVHVPGDFVDLHGFAMKRLDHDVCALGEARVACVSHRALGDIMQNEPHLARILWFSTLLDAAMHREWIFRLGRLSAKARLAHFICELHARMSFVGLVQNNVLDIPLTQQDLAEICGVSPIHINRVAAELREENIATLVRPLLFIHDLQALQDMCQFDSTYLYGEGSLHVDSELKLD
jgi:CRP-like cAMP-binding protein